MTTIDPDRFQYLSQWKYVEIAHYIPKLDRVIRDQNNKIPIMVEWSELSKLREQYDNLGLYTSVWRYDSKDVETAKRLGSLYFDFDSDPIEEAQEDALKLVNYLLEYIPKNGIRVYFTGAKGFHVEVEAVTAGITPSNSLPNLFRYIAGELQKELDLKTLDFSVYDQRRMWRLPGSKHQKTGLYKTEIAPEELSFPIERIKELAEVAAVVECDPELEFSAKANAWYREFSYRQEAAKTVSLEERIARFNKHGTNIIKRDIHAELVFDPESLFKHCPAILALWEKAEQDHHLLHEERLFLLSILSYTDEAIEYLIQILSSCTDFNIDKSRSHIDDWIRRRELGIGGRPYSCARAASVGIGCNSCDLEPKERMERVGDSFMGTGEMAEPSPIRFAYHKKSNFPSTPVTINRQNLKYI